MAGMQAVYYRASDGREPVDAFIEGLADPDRQAALDNQIERLNMLRPNDLPLPFPWSSQLEGEFRELRCHYGSELYRVTTAARATCPCFCTCSAKTAARFPRSAPDREERREDFKARMDAARRRPPRAAGHDAP